MPGVGLMVRVVGLGSSDAEFKSHSAVELIPGGVDSGCHPVDVGKMSASLPLSCGGVATRPVLCPIAHETASAAPTLCTEYGPNGMDGSISPTYKQIHPQHQLFLTLLVRPTLLAIELSRYNGDIAATNETIGADNSQCMRHGRC